jgi:3D (Asp-Asp-Asp) domain-containing protein
LTPFELAFVVTAYSWGCGATGLTFTERFPEAGRTAAVDPRVVPLFSRLAIPGKGVLIAEDTGSGVKGRRIDIFLPTCAEAREFGRQVLQVLVLPEEVE